MLWVSCSYISSDKASLTSCLPTGQSWVGTVRWCAAQLVSCVGKRHEAKAMKWGSWWWCWISRKLQHRHMCSTETVSMGGGGGNQGGTGFSNLPPDPIYSPQVTRQMKNDLLGHQIRSQTRGRERGRERDRETALQSYISRCKCGRYIELCRRFLWSLRGAAAQTAVSCLLCWLHRSFTSAEQTFGSYILVSHVNEICGFRFICTWNWVKICLFFYNQCLVKLLKSFCLFKRN